MILSRLSGGIAQLVERLVRNEKARGSNPLTSRLRCPSVRYGGNPDKPIAWGVSSYNKLYNWNWFYSGYHAEHHFRPKVSTN